MDTSKATSGRKIKLPKREPFNVSTNRWKIVLLLGLCQAAVVARADERTKLAPDYQACAEEQREDFGYRPYTTEDRFGRQIRFYLSKSKTTDQQLPLVTCIQGSGCQSIFLRHEGRIASGGPEAVVARYFRDRVRVLVVEKPGVEFLFQPARVGSAEDGSVEFNREFSLDRWVRSRACRHAGSQEVTRGG